MDDITLMCITNKTAKQHPTIVITNDIEELQRVKSIVREYCDCLGCEPHLTRKIMLAVEEAVANIINYAYPKESLGRIEIELQGRSASCKGQKGDLTVTITDFGEPFDPTARQEVDVTKNIEKRQIGGLGIYLYLKLMDSCIYQRTEDGRNVLIMTKGISK
jgi:sigma-B regulation protein RsbU (phosphoserine phosphatase)